MQKNRALNKKSINEYLHFGYLPVERDKYPFCIEDVSLNKQDYSSGKVIQEAYQLFEQILSDSSTSKPVIVPLSGGIDSRIILAELYKQLEPEKITAVTFGVPGSLDFELPQKVTRKFGISHHLINLYEQDFSEKKLLDFAAHTQVPSLLVEAYCNDLLRKKMGKKVTIYSGFIGDRIVGSMARHLREIKSFNEAKHLFIRNSKHDKTGFLPVLDVESFEVDDDGYTFLGPYEKIDYKIRLRNMTMAIVLDQNYDYKTPLIDPRLISFFHSIDPRFRDNQVLFFEMAGKYYPEFFNIGVKNFFGAPIQSSQIRKNIARKVAYGRRILHRKFPSLPLKDPLVNYADPFWFYVKNRSTATMVEKSISDLAKRKILKERNPQIALDKLKQGKMEFVHAVELLFNLEIYLKTGAFS